MHSVALNSWAVIVTVHCIYSLSNFVHLTLDTEIEKKRQLLGSLAEAVYAVVFALQSSGKLTLESLPNRYSKYLLTSNGQYLLVLGDKLQW